MEEFILLPAVDTMMTKFIAPSKLKLVMDRGFYSERNINDMMKHHHKFLIGAKTSLKIVSRRLNEIRDNFVTL